MSPLYFRTKERRRLHINIATDTHFSEILKVFEEIFLKNLAVNYKEIEYALLELISNAMRAQKNHNPQGKIEIIFNYTKKKFLAIIIKDRAGGFDMSGLPYSPNQDINEIDIQGPAFREYQKKHQYKRFGMGLIIAKRTFPSFHISFQNEDCYNLEWCPGKTIGTRIIVRIPEAEVESA